ncbi:MAG: HD domain-containing protein, partial [Bacillota bacterium]
MNRLERVRQIVDGILLSQEDIEERRCGYVHLYGVSALAALLATKRGLDADIACTAAMLHDIYSYRTHLTANHAHNSEEDARVILRDLGLFSDEEQRLIRSAIFHHSDKKRIDQPYDELVKDADVFQHYLYNTNFPLKEHAASHNVRNELTRLKAIHTELGLPFKPVVVPAAVAMQEEPSMDKRAKLADIAEALAAKPLAGDQNKSGPDVFPIIRYFPGATPDQGFDWCAAFVYHCCMQAGLILPIKYPDPVPCRFAGVPAWQIWAQLPQTGFYHPAGVNGFVPQRGDIVVYDAIVSEAPHDHIGVVLAYMDCELTTAEGNVNNRSGIFQRDAVKNVNGYIRIDNHYQ